MADPDVIDALHTIQTVIAAGATLIAIAIGLAAFSIATALNTLSRAMRKEIESDGDPVEKRMLREGRRRQES